MPWLSVWKVDVENVPERPLDPTRTRDSLLFVFLAFLLCHEITNVGAPPRPDLMMRLPFHFEGDHR